MSARVTHLRHDSLINEIFKKSIKKLHGNPSFSVAQDSWKQWCGQFIAQDVVFVQYSLHKFQMGAQTQGKSVVPLDKPRIVAATICSGGNTSVSHAMHDVHMSLRPSCHQLGQPTSCSSFCLFCFLRSFSKLLRYVLFCVPGGRSRWHPRILRHSANPRPQKLLLFYNQVSREVALRRTSRVSEHSWGRVQ